MGSLTFVVKNLILFLIFLVLGCKSKNLNNAKLSLHAYEMRLAVFNLHLEPFQRKSENSKSAFPDSISRYFSYKNYCHFKNDSLQVLIASNSPGEKVLVVFNTKANSLHMETFISFNMIRYKKLSRREFHCVCSKLWEY